MFGQQSIALTHRNGCVFFKNPNNAIYEEFFAVFTISSYFTGFSARFRSVCATPGYHSDSATH
jgi:hypothetical protein